MYFFKDISSSLTIFELVLQLREVKLEGNKKLYLIHIDRNRTIGTVLDIFSRGETLKVVIERKDMISFFLFSPSVIKRSPVLLEYIYSLWPGGR